MRVDPLFGQRNTPVCSPSLVDGKPPLRRPTDLRHHTLLHIDWKDAEASWRMWFLAAGLDPADAMDGPRFSEEAMAVQAALDGHGVALIGDRLVTDHLAGRQAGPPVRPGFQHPAVLCLYLLSAGDSTRRQKSPPSATGCLRKRRRPVFDEPESAKAR